MKKNKEMFSSKGTILIILILFMFSSRILDIIWDICKSLIYLILIIYFINYLNPILAKKIKEIINDFIDIDTLSKLSTAIIYKITSNIYVKSNQDMIIQNDTFRNKINRNLENINQTTNRKLS